jgi:hypothetical protein
MMNVNECIKEVGLTGLYATPVSRRRDFHRVAVQRGILVHVVVSQKGNTE